ncbi:TPA: hypothetical protein HA251_06315 [Candidatus Woesearchaeota archaeon]|nr:hypothetical protein [Candidatus Woesearchaeota archaeon]
MDASILKEIGLTDSEIKVYLALLELGDATRNNIVTRSQIAGSKVYEILDKLQTKGLVAIYSQNNIKHFKPLHPNQILNYVDEEKQRIVDVERQVKTILPGLLDLYGEAKSDQEVELLFGLRGLDIIFREQVELLKRNDTCYVIGGTLGSNEPGIVSFFQKIHSMREHKGIKTKMLYSVGQKATVEKAYKNYAGTSVRYIQHTSPVAINIYRDRAIIIMFGKRISAVHIKSADVAKSFLEYFELLWKGT